jgi:hypothetical protein
VPGCTPSESNANGPKLFTFLKSGIALQASKAVAQEVNDSLGLELCSSCADGRLMECARCGWTSRRWALSVGLRCLHQLRPNSSILIFRPDMQLWRELIIFES